MTYKILPLILLTGALVGCSTSSAEKSPEVAGTIRTSLDQAGLKDVSVSQDRDKGVVTLTGHVAAESDKQQAESLAKSMSSGQVVADEIVVLPPGAESDTKKMSAAVDDGITSNVKALLIQNGWNDNVKYTVKAAVVTLTGTVDSGPKRTDVAKAITAVPNVTQVVNELQIKAQKASSRGGQ